MKPYPHPTPSWANRMSAQLAWQVATLALPVGVSLTPYPASERRLQLSPSLHVRLSLSSGVAVAALSLALISSPLSTSLVQGAGSQQSSTSKARSPGASGKAVKQPAQGAGSKHITTGLHEDCFPVLLLSCTHGKKLCLVCYLALMFSITCYM